MSPRTGEENQRIREERYETIVEAAAKVFARKGFAATKVADIAAAAGMSHGLVYHYFASKEAVFGTLVDRAITGAAMVTEGARQQPGTPWEQLRWMTDLMLAGVRYQPEYFQVVLQTMTSDSIPADLREKSRQQGDGPRMAMIHLIEAGQASGEVVSGNPEQLANVFYACIQGLAVSAAFYTEMEMAFPTVDQVMRILKP